MAKDMSVLLVVDLESTCWETRDEQGAKQGEIIEIGVTPISLRNLTLEESYSLYVRPLLTEVSPFCTQLTGITQGMVANAPHLAAAMAELAARHHPLKDKTWASWGDYDRRQFERQCAAEGAVYPFGVTHLNVKNLFALARGQRECGMAEALEQLGMLLNGRHHSGKDDSRNIAHILVDLLRTTREALPTPG